MIRLAYALVLAAALLPAVIADRRGRIHFAGDPADEPRASEGTAQ